VNGSFSRALEPAAADVLAAGAVLWRRRDDDGHPGEDGVEVALVHRPRYDDWSFPKGKLDTGESLPVTAVREVQEETGQACRLDAILGDVRYEVPEGRKLVRYWAAQARGGEFVPGDETDELRWLDPAAAAEQLSYPHDREVLGRFTELGPPASVVALVRHAKAGSRSQWDGDDNLRPLSGSGREQAQRLARLLPLFGPDRIVTAPPLRCRDTVAPVAEALELPISEEPLFGEERYWKDPTESLACLRKLAALPGVTVVSSQGGVIPEIVRALVTSARLPGVDPDDIRARKGSTWLLTFAPDGSLRTADHYDRPTH
jgi:8-oxo-dGTP diphosphatase